VRHEKHECVASMVKYGIKIEFNIKILSCALFLCSIESQFNQGEIKSGLENQGKISDFSSGNFVDTLLDTTEKINS